MSAKKKHIPPTPAAEPPVQQPARPPADNPQLRHAAGARTPGGREEALQRLRALEELERMKSAGSEEAADDDASK
jgi:hypothetical protein